MFGGQNTNQHLGNKPTSPSVTREMERITK